MGLSESVDILITSATKTVSRQGFGTILILAENYNFPTRTVEFETTGTDLADALCGGSDSEEYKAVAAAFSQDIPPENIKLGAVIGTKKITFTGTYTAGAVTGKINGNNFTAAYNSNKDTTLTALAAALAAADTTNVASAVYAADIITITPNSGKLLAVTELDLSGITGTMTEELTAQRTEALDDALDAIVLYDDDFYGIMEVGRVQSDQEDVAAWAKAYTASPKIVGIGSADSDIPDTTDAGDTTTIAAVLKALTNSRAFVIYGGNVGGSPAEHPDAALMGNIFARDPGRYTACYKNLVSVTADELTATQSTNIRAKYANSYENIGGTAIIRWGKVASGDYIDYIIFKDWLTSRLTESIYSLLVNSAKVPYDRDGFAAIEAAMIDVFKEGQRKDANGIQAITDYSEDSSKKQDGGYWIEFPALEDIPAADKTDRLLQGVKFAVWYTNGIHTVQITGAIVL